MIDVQHIDRGALSFLPVCSCGWRGSTVLVLSRAWVQARDHASHAHGNAQQASRALVAAQTREARTGG